MRAAAVGLALLASGPAAAHGFGMRYDLPLPLSLYLFATAAAIVLSFVVVAWFVRRPSERHEYPHVDLFAHRPGVRASLRALGVVLRLVVLVLALVTVAAGFVGNPDPYRNIAPTMVWIVFWVGMVYVSAFAGDLWSLVNPWRTLFEAAQWLSRRLRRGRSLALDLPYPDALGVWPAVVLLYAVAWIELVYPSPAVPLHLAWLALGYSIVTWAGMLVFGCGAWLRHGEVFSVLFTLLARFAPLESRGAGGSSLALRPFAAGLFDARAVSTSMSAFVLLVLSTVLYDGLLATPQWAALESSLTALAPSGGDVTAIVLRTVGLGILWAIFFGAYAGVCALMSRLVGGSRSMWQIARGMALTLVPIAIGYHVAHYLAYLLIQGQYIVPLLSDPFGRGWDLFGTAGYRVDVGIVGARFEWYAAVAAIVVGHIVAVWLAHRRAMHVFDSRARVLRSQIPLTALMVAYTFVSLSILAQPITEERPGAEAAVPAGSAIPVPPDALVPVAGGAPMQRVAAGATAKEKLTYRMLGSTFQDGMPMTVADLYYAYVFAWRWGTRGDGGDAHYDAAVDAATATMRRRLVGVRFAGVDTTSKSFRVDDINVVRQLFIVDVWLSTAPDEREQDAAVAPPWTTLPWDLLVLMEEAVSRGYAAFSEEEAKRRGVEWLDLARSPALAQRLADMVDAFARDGYRPPALESMVSADEARKRWHALAEFHRAHGHFLVTNGPYVLKSWNADSATLDVWRDLSYPLGVGSFDGYAVPRRGFVTSAVQSGNALVLAADIETVEKHARSYDIARVPLPTLSPGDLGRALPQCRYMIQDAQGNVVLAGTVDPAEDRTFRIDLGDGLATGRYTAVVEITVDGNAANAEIRRIPVEIARSAASPK